MKNTVSTAGHNKRWTLERTLPYILIVGGILGLIASFVLTLDTIKLAGNPNAQLNCNINPIISCGSVMKTDEGKIFGFANPIIGLSVFAVIITIGTAMLAGAKFKRWFWLGLNLGALGGAAMIHFLFFSSVFRIHALCPYCMLTWASVMPMFWYITLYNLRQGHLKCRPKVSAFVQKYHGELLTGWYLTIILIILNQFWYYWRTLI